MMADVSKSFRQPAIIVEHVLVIDAAEWLLEVCSAVAPNHQQAFRKIKDHAFGEHDQGVRERLR